MASKLSSSVLGRYVLFQIPDLILLGLGLAAAVRWWGMPPKAAYGIVVLWLVKDVVLYPVMRIAYQSGESSTMDRTSGARGIARQSLDPSGYVAVGSELWNAEVGGENGPIAAGSAVRVVGSRGLTLLVEPLSSEEDG